MWRMYIFDPTRRKVVTRKDDNAVHAVLGDKWWRAEEIAERLQIRKAMAVQALVRLRAAGKAQHDGFGNWRANT